MIDRQGVRGPGAGEIPELRIGKGLWVGVIWAAGLASTVYLVGYALFFLLLAVAFSSASKITTLDHLAQIGTSAAPACLYAVIGITGLTFLSSRRYWILGLSAISVEIALAIHVLANPGCIPLFTAWLL